MKWNSLKHIYTTVMLATFIMMLLGLPAFAETELQKLDVNTPSQDEILQYIKDHPTDFQMKDTYQREAVLSAPYEAGDLSGESEQNALNLVNQIRFIAGLHEVAIDDHYSIQAQAAAMLEAVNGKAAYKIDKPEDMDDELYTTASEGLSNCIPQKGHLADAVNRLWMGAVTDSEKSSVYSRKWILNPRMSMTGFGSAAKGSDTYVAMYAKDKGNETATSMVEWPAKNMPVEYFDSSYPWSVSIYSSTKDKIEFGEDTQVILTRTRLGSTEEIEVKNVTAVGYRNDQRQAALIFSPNVTTYMEGDSFHVLIKENGTSILEYDVNFFSLEPLDENVQINAQVPKTGIKVGDDSSYVVLELSDTSVPVSKIEGIIADTSVAELGKYGKENKSGNPVIYLKGKSVGKTTARFTLPNGSSTSFIVNVVDANHKHSYTEQLVSKPATCREEGKLYTKVCACGALDSKKYRTLPKKDHQYSVVPGKAATCTESGMTDGTVCTECGEIINEQQEIPALGHEVKPLEAKAATCTESGLTEGSYCGRCNIVLESQKEIPKLGHTMDGGTIQKKATCHGEGELAYLCKRCGELMKTEAIPSLSDQGKEIGPSDHTKPLVWTVIQEPTCETPGIFDGWCDECDEEIDGGELPPKGHDLEKVPELPATCTKEGTAEHFTCKSCGKLFRDEDGTVEIMKADSLPMLEHGWDSGVVTKKATTSSEGVKTYTCKVCGAQKTETIPKLKGDKDAQLAKKAAGYKVNKFTVKAQKKHMAKITWARTSGADGYQIVRSLKKSGKYKSIKVISKGKTVKYTDKKLKKGKTYYYKIRPYTKVAGKTIYGKYSRVVKIKAK